MNGDNAKFLQEVNAFVDGAKAKVDIVAREAMQDFCGEIQTPIGEGGNMPVDTNFLRASFNVENGSYTPRSEKPTPGVTYVYSPQPVALVINNMKAGDVLYGTYGANYARPVHYGANGRPGRQWITLAAQRWQQIVDGAVQRFAGASGGA